MRKLLFVMCFLIGANLANACCDSCDVEYYGIHKCSEGCGGSASVFVCRGPDGVGCDATAYLLPCGGNCEVYSAGACIGEVKASNTFRALPTEGAPRAAVGAGVRGCGNSEAFASWFADHLPSAPKRSNGGL